MDVDLLLCELDSETLCLVHTKELRNAHSDKCCLVSILKLIVHLLNLSLHAIDAIEKALLGILRGLTTGLAVLSHHTLNLRKHATELILKLDKLDEALLEDVGEVKKAKSMASGRRIENDKTEVVLVERLDDFAEGSGLVNAWH